MARRLCATWMLIAALPGSTSALAAADATQRAADLQKHLGNFQFSLTHHGNTDKPFYSLHLTTGEPMPRVPGFLQHLRISRPQAQQLIHFLKDSGVLAVAKPSSTSPPRTTPCYLLRVQGGSTDISQVLSWDLTMLRVLDGLQAILEPPADKPMRALRDRLSGFRKQWEEAADASANFAYTARGGRLRFTREGEATVIHIVSKTGIGNAVVHPRSAPWPRTLILRCHLRGLESLKLTAGEQVMEVALSSTQPHRARVSQRGDGQERPIARTSPLWTEVRIVGEFAHVPLKQNGFFEIAVPTRLLQDNAAQLQLDWIDFYR